MATDPLSKAMHAARTKILFNRPELVEAGRLRFVDATEECGDMELKDTTLRYNEYVKSLSLNDLELMIARLLSRERIRKF
jgi:hypothetical protein